MMIESSDGVMRELRELNLKLRETCGGNGLRYDTGASEDRKRLLEMRRAVVRDVKGFWIHAMIKDETLGGQLSGFDVEVMRYLEEVNLEESTPGGSFTISFTFRDNPFFDNRELRKEVTCDGSTVTSLLPTAIQWNGGEDTKAWRKVVDDNHAKCPETFSFFRWIESDEDPLGLAAHIRNEFFVDAIGCYFSEVTDEWYETETQTEDQDEEDRLLDTDDED